MKKKEVIRDIFFTMAVIATTVATHILLIIAISTFFSHL
jgi:hypothetical protein